MLAAEAAPVGTSPHHSVDLGRQDDVVAGRHFAEVKPGALFAQPGGVNIGGVEEIDSCIQRNSEMLACILFVHVPSARALRPGRHLASAVAHASQAKAGYGNSSVAKSCKFHRF